MLVSGRVYPYITYTYYTYYTNISNMKGEIFSVIERLIPLTSGSFKTYTVSTLRLRRWGRGGWLRCRAGENVLKLMARFPTKRMFGRWLKMMFLSIWGWFSGFGLKIFLGIKPVFSDVLPRYICFFPSRVDLFGSIPNMAPCDFSKRYLKIGWL